MFCFGSEGERRMTREFFSGELSRPYFCAKSNGEYCLFRRGGLGSRYPANDSISGWKVKDDLSEEGKDMRFEKGQFYEIRLGTYPKALTFGKGTKVLALKPTQNGEFSVKFSPAKIVSEAKTCSRGSSQVTSKKPMSYVRTDETRHEYEVKFDDEKDKTYRVYEKLIVPLEKHWGNVKDSYTAKDNGDEEKASDDESSSEKTSDDESSSDEKEKKKYHHKHHKHHSHSKRGNEQPSIIIMPIIIPYGSAYPQVPYFPYQ